MVEKLEDSNTRENLRAAFLAEASLTYRYQYFAVVAEFEGLDRLARLFREFAEGGQQSVLGCLDFLRHLRDPDSNVPLGGTRSNLESVLQTETQQSSEIYPEMARIARDEGFTDIASWFDTLEKLKRTHASRLKQVENG